MGDTVGNASAQSNHLLMSDVYASREFKLKPTKGKTLLLRGMTAPSIMHSGVQVSQCFKKNHVAPMTKCTCGFYSFDSQRWYVSRTRFLPPSPGSVKAIVRLSGKIITHDLGVRAERMEVVALCVNKWDAPRLDDEYSGIPKYLSITEMFNDFPISPLPRQKQSPIHDLKQTIQESRRKLSLQMSYRVETLHEWGTLLGATAIAFSLFLMFHNELISMAWLFALFGGVLARLYSQISFPEMPPIAYLGLSLLYCVVVPVAGITMIGFSFNADSQIAYKNALNSVYGFVVLLMMNTYVFRNLPKFIAQWIKSLRNKKTAV